MLKFYETLKQQRFAHFLTIQTAFLAIFGLLAKEAIGVFSLVTMATLVVIPIPPLFIAYYFLALDVRGRAFIDTANTRLLMIEQEWKALFPDNHFATYQRQFAVLSRRDPAILERYRTARGLAGDAFPKSVEAPSAHVSETAILRLFWWLWIIVFSFPRCTSCGTWCTPRGAPADWGSRLRRDMPCFRYCSLGGPIRRCRIICIMSNNMNARSP